MFLLFRLDVSMYQCLYLSTYLSMYACMHACIVFIVVPSCLSFSLFNVFSFLHQFVFFPDLWVCLCWVTGHFEQTLSKWPEEPVVYPNRGSPGHLLQHEKIQQVFTKDGWLIWSQVNYICSCYLPIHVYLSCVLSICPSIYLHYSTVLIIPLQVDLSLFPLSSFHLFDFLSF